jgi:NAD(P)-dependent dehydrogenase (short-subunit alcohol dehydrogenase family)
MGKWHKGWWAAAGITAVLGKILSDQRQAQQTSRHIFKGKVAIVTGGASGIGQALCAGLARRGAQVVVADINEGGADTVAQAINVSGGQARPAMLDVTDKEAVTQLVQGVAAEYGRLDYIFNNAGIGISGYMQDISQEAWEEIVNINLWSVIYGTQAAYEVMLRQGHGHIVNTASLAGLIPTPAAIPYGVVKHGVVGLSTSLRAEAEPLGIKVSVICPGFISTPIFNQMMYHSRNKEKVLAGIHRVQLPSAEACADAALIGVAANRGIIAITPMAHLFWRIFRLNPDWLPPLLRRLTP